MALLFPCPRYSPKSKDCPALPAGQQLDYSMTSPIGTNDPLCKHTVPYAKPSETWTAGQSITITFEGSAIHGGGHCQWSISYDGGKTFVVLYQVLGNCFTGNSGGANAGYPYTFKLPSDLPSSDHAVFAWSWVNAVGNREFYMNCADVAIKGSSATSFSGKEMVIANHAGYPTIPEFSGNPKTGENYYTGAKTITVTASGSSSGGGGGGSSDSASAAAPSDNYGSGDSESLDMNSPLGHVAYGGFPSDSVSSAPVVPPPNDDSMSQAQASDDEQPSILIDSDLPSPGASDADYGPDDGGSSIDDGGPSIDDGDPSGGSSAAASAGGTTGGSGACSPDGQMVCASSGYQICNHGSWTATLPCAPGTACKAAGSSIICDFA
ncbi:hypothetical protein IW140_003802 [Coemansia sp. RSA 1813]|nr:hypothetical protein EV178_004558 [Coemansia sp. RSA 1646]KAJ1769759.1 hypothetical protein LPJ74_003784 [Coemansia sp. RSA 1843]KAJ2090110.1 hypothetical protein IW138_002920 [Coemansia sp. RSA 986]KAJ2214187.1 hypothetical protein EV179_003207 [Coemansia sp. RSA 487]KAJ2568484.1 hypothetical protein IW140_003802 [Coemansia sp. RSA 1813]